MVKGCSLEEEVTHLRIQSFWKNHVGITQIASLLPLNWLSRRYEAMIGLAQG